MATYEDVTDPTWLRSTANQADAEVHALQLEVGKLNTRIENAKRLRDDCLTQLRLLRVYGKERG